MNVSSHFRLLLPILLLMLAPLTATAQQVDCTRPPVVYDAATNGSTALLTGAATTRIFICGFHIVWGGTATVKLVTGTGTACATNEASITPAYSGVAQTVLPDSSPFWRGLVVNPGLDLCIKTSAGVAVQALVFYSQR